VADEWREVDGALEKRFRFGSFPETMAFANRIAEAAEAADHHPQLTILGREVTVRWWTHSAAAITDRDRSMAEQTDGLA
jgi:4a-hydroxytetrahydrobiopterin dehydratase